MPWWVHDAMRSLANFYAGPGKLPERVLSRLQNELRDYRGSGMSVMEINHRAPPVLDLIERVTQKIKGLLELDEQDEVLLLQGGGSLQFIMAPLNFSAAGDPVDYVDTGYWAQKAIQAAQELGRDVSVVAQSHIAIPEQVVCRTQAKFLHLCTNNTVMGTQWHSVPEISVPIVADASSDFLSRPFDYKVFGACYAHAQKTVGTAGITIVVIRKDMLAQMQPVVPQFLGYRAHIDARSNYHTPPVFAIHVVECMLDWLIDDIGGLEAMGTINATKAALLYEHLDQSECFNAPVAVPSRSQMNVVFELNDPARQDHFLASAERAGILGLAAHRSRGGLRASLYNAVTLEEVEQLVDFLRSYEGGRLY